MALITTSSTKPKFFIFSPLCLGKKSQNNTKALNFSHSNLKSKKIYTSSVPCVHSSNKRKLFAIVNAASVEATEPEPEPESEVRSWGRILLSDVVVKRKRRVFFWRNWNSLDISTAGVVLAMHLLSVFAPFHFTWSAFWVAFGLYVVTGLLGITLSFHRNLSHRSFKLPKWLEYLFAYCGVQALQGNPIDWVSTHRYHHQFCDSERDPHSPLEGFWFSHMSWLFDTQFCDGKMWRTKQCWGLREAAFLQISEKLIYSSSNCNWSFAICIGRLSLHCVGNGKKASLLQALFHTQFDLLIIIMSHERIGKALGDKVTPSLTITSSNSY
ncbi:hypothetical protein Patl1_34532 [Pistacia atlantica]|uniref:Uncharacterized protein n=1 Tax=Pistacia atlantica TaxID=434234 RepID=A0ACC0ZT19_9ROSI|nr:hypothetical protein Patl1_34532 [Pistacia atlantica]